MLGLGLRLGLRPQIAGLGLGLGPESHGLGLGGCVLGLGLGLGLGVCSLGLGLGGCGLGLGLDMCGLVNITASPSFPGPYFVVSLVSMTMTLAAIVVLCMETMPTFSEHRCGRHQSSVDPFFVGETVCTIWFTVELVVRLASCPSKRTFFLDFKNVVDLRFVLQRSFLFSPPLPSSFLSHLVSSALVSSLSGVARI